MHITKSSNAMHPRMMYPNLGPPLDLEVSQPTIANAPMVDSFYEYMLKVWIQGGKVEPLYRKMYDKAIQGMHDELVQVSKPSGLTYIADKIGDRYDHKMDHLVCK